MNSYRPEKPLQEVVQDWADSNPHVKSHETVRLMQGALDRFQEYIGRDATVGDLTEKNVTGFMRHRKFQGRSPFTIEREGNKCATLWRWAAKRGWCAEPLVSIRKAAPPTPIAWNRHEMKRLLKAADSHETTFKISVDGRCYRLPGKIVMGVLLRMLFDTGERITAAKRLEWADVDLGNRLVLFRAAYRKNGDKDNQQRISRATRRAFHTLRDWYGYQGLQVPSLVFPACDKASYYYHLRLIFKLAGLPADKRVGFHQIRRTHATALCIMGGDATQSLGHSDSKMTRDWYIDPRQTRKDFAADIMSGGLLNPLRFLGRRVKAAFGLW